MFFSREQLKEISHGDAGAVRKLDDAGIFCGDQEDAMELSRRLEQLQENLHCMEDALRRNGKFTINGVSVYRDSRIPAEFFDVSSLTTERLYKFSCRWVPGFFTGSEMGGFLFGGCAISFFPDFLALFLIRSSFRDRKKWLFYDRDELLSHELCHIARIGLESVVFEEIFAYATSKSVLRRLTGGVFHSAIDAYAFVGVTFLLLAAQIVRTFWLEWLPIWPFWLILGGTFLFFIVRHIYDMLVLARARRNLARIFKVQDVMPILFRCTDQEIFAFSRMSKEELREDIVQKGGHILRWRTTLAKFPLADETPAEDGQQ